MSITIENLNEKGFFYNDAGSKTLAPGEILYLLMKAHKASVLITVSGTSYYMVSATQASTDKVKDGTATYVDADDVDFIETDDYIVRIGSGIKIENKSYSTDNIVVDWRI
jgi:hypothetical protein